MREDYMIKLEQMFPEGYIILYTNPNGKIRLSKYNPKKYWLIEHYDREIKQLRDNGDV